MLDINNDLYASHANLLTHGRKFKGLDDNNYEEFLNNDLIPVSATYGLNAANSIQTKISFGMPKKSKVGKAIDLEGNEILTFQQLRRSKYR